MSHRISALQQVDHSLSATLRTKKRKTKEKNKTQQKHVEGYSNILTIALQVF